MVDIIDNLTGKVIGEGSVTNTRHFPEEISAIRNADQDAIEIGNLFRRATGRSENHRCNSGASHPTPDDQKQTTVTSIRHFSGRMSGSRNADRQPDKYPEGSTDGCASSHHRVMSAITAVKDLNQDKCATAS